MRGSHEGAEPRGGRRLETIPTTLRKRGKMVLLRRTVDFAGTEAGMISSGEAVLRRE